MYPNALPLAFSRNASPLAGTNGARFLQSGRTLLPPAGTATRLRLEGCPLRRQHLACADRVHAMDNS